MTTKLFKYSWLPLAILFILPFRVDAAPNTDAKPAFWKEASKPPMGWNSFDCFGDSVTEAEVLANARYIKEKLLKHGYNYVVVDIRWHGGLPKRRPSVDAYGRWMPATNRFPSAMTSDGFSGLADQIHAMGLKFGIHIMRGIALHSVRHNFPIEGSTYRAVDAANTNSLCPWNGDTCGVNGDTPAGQAWYDSIFRQYAAWKVDYIKVDDISRPYSSVEIEAVRKAIDRCGRPMVLSLSPGPAPKDKGSDVMMKANLWRISDDFWDSWGHLNPQFDLLSGWAPYIAPGHWADADMIALGKLDLHGENGGRFTRLTKDEQITHMTLWALAPSPLMLGMNLPDNDDWTFSLLTNDEVLAVNQDPEGCPAKRVAQSGSTEVWMKPLRDGSKAVGLFNRGETAATVTAKWNDLELHGKQRIRDLWQHKGMGTAKQEFSVEVPPHGAKLVLVRPTRW